MHQIWLPQLLIFLLMNGSGIFGVEVVTDLTGNYFKEDNTRKVLLIFYLQ